MIDIKAKRAENMARLSGAANYTYVVSGHTVRINSKTNTVGCGVKVGQTQDYCNRFNQLSKKGSITPHCIFCCESKDDAEVLEAVLRRHYLKMNNAKRNGTDWIEGISASQYSLKNILKDPFVQTVLFEINPIFIMEYSSGKFQKMGVYEEFI